MDALERDIETALYYCPALLPEPFRGGGALSWLARQYNVPSGRIDLLGVYACGDWRSAVVVELKRGAVDAATLAQVCRYAADITQIIDHIAATNGILTVLDSRVFKVVIGRSIDRHVSIAAEGMDVIPFGYSIDAENRLRLGHFKFSNDEGRWSKYAQLAEDSPFEYWVKKARIEGEILWGRPTL